MWDVPYNLLLGCQNKKVKLGATHWAIEYSDSDVSKRSGIGRETHVV